MDNAALAIVVSKPLNWLCPIGYEDERGFHYGVDPDDLSRRIQTTVWDVLSLDGGFKVANISFN